MTSASTMNTTLASYATFSAIAAIGNPRPLPSSTKKLLLDAQIYLGSTHEELVGVITYFNGSNLTFGINDIGLYQIECTFAKFDPNIIDSHPTPLSPPRYAFAGDIQRIIPLALSVCKTDTDCSDFPFDPRFQPYVHITGAATNCEKPLGTFDLDVQQYISTTKPNQNNKIVVSISCYIPDSPRWKTSKPVPYNNRYTSITGLLTDVSLNTEATNSEEKQPIECFHITVNNVVFTGTRGAITGNTTSPNILDKATAPIPHSGKCLMNYGNCQNPAPSANPSPALETSPLTSAESTSVSPHAAVITTENAVAGPSTLTRANAADGPSTSKCTKKN